MFKELEEDEFDGELAEPLDEIVGEAFTSASISPLGWGEEDFDRLLPLSLEKEMPLKKVLIAAAAEEEVLGEDRGTGSLLLLTVPFLSFMKAMLNG